MPGAVNVKIAWTRPGGSTAPVITSPAFLVAGTVGTLYPTTTFTATGTAPITWSVTAGTLPTGMAFSSAGVLSGTPTATASGSITFTATNAQGADSRTLTLTVNAAGAGPTLVTAPTISAWPGPGQATPAPNPPYAIPSVLVVNVATWANQYSAGDYPVQRRHQWIKDGVDIPGAIGLSYTPSVSGSYSVRETAWFLNTAGNVFADGPATVSTSSSVSVTGTKDSALVFKEDLTYLGAFQVSDPSGAPSDFYTFAYGGNGIAFDPAGNFGAGSLFMIGSKAGPYPQVGEIAIPSQATWATNDSQTPPFASVLSGPTLVEPTEGKYLTACQSGATLTGLAVDSSNVYMTFLTPYNYNYASWVFQRPKNLAITGQVKGPFSITDAAVWDNSRAYSGYISPVPSALQTKLGGPFIMGAIADSIASATSDGPTIASFDPSSLSSLNSSVLTGTVSTATATQIYLSGGSTTTGAYNNMWIALGGNWFASKIISYDGPSQTATVASFLNNQVAGTPTPGLAWCLVPHLDAKALGLWRVAEFQNWEVGYTGKFMPTIYDPIFDYPYAAIPNGTRSVLVVTTGGNGLYTYGVGSGSEPSNGEISGNGSKVYDPTSGTRGEHSYPYYGRCIAFDANDLEQVRLGNTLAKNVKPYAVWNFNPPFKGGSQNRPSGAAYDPATKRLFLSYAQAMPAGKPIIHVYQVNNAS